MDLEKTCRILGDHLAARLFESGSAAKAAFPTLSSPRELGNDTALIVKCVEDDFEGRCGQKDGINPDITPFLDILYSRDTPIPNGASPESAPMAKYRIDRKSGRIRKSTRATTKPTGSILQVGECKNAVPQEVFMIYLCRQRRAKRA
ncbi:hypothetical protein BGZ60DRAFT_421586 [Tricladium varicosporioides]|nr:hypothetical protein BGZ60DRAFT_421586 [Hymenoscyphus varicosporioides]